jgi:hypothetical protein
MEARWLAMNNSEQRYTSQDELRRLEERLCIEFDGVCPVDVVLELLGLSQVYPTQDFFDRAQNGIEYSDGKGHECIVKNGLCFRDAGTEAASASHVFFVNTGNDNELFAMSAMARMIGWTAEANKLAMTGKYQREEYEKLNKANKAD